MWNADFELGTIRPDRPEAGVRPEPEPLPRNRIWKPSPRFWPLVCSAGEHAMKLNGLAEAWLEQQQQPQSGDLSFDERLAMLVERQWIWKENRALVTRLKFAQLKQSACLEDIDYRHPRGLKRAVVEQLASCEWIRHHRHCIITGPTGVGKSYLAPDQYRLFLEILDDRQGTGANLITSQYPVKTWHALIGDPTVGDAILDRLVHSAFTIDLDGDSMRKKRSKKS